MSNEKKRILIMEDSDIFADMLLEVLYSEDYILERAVNGLEGIKKVYSFLPHLIVTDIEMPLFKGYQVTRFLKSRKSTMALPVIMFTTLGETKDKFWGLTTGADMYIEKSPDNFQPLQEAVKMMLTLPRNIDFSAIEREAKKVNDDSIIETINSILDNKLFQTTVINKLMELSDNTYSFEKISMGILDLLQTICEVEIATMMIRGVKGMLYIHTSNFAQFTEEAINDFTKICVSDFNKHFSDFQVKATNTEEFFSAGNNEKKIQSYIIIPLVIGGEKYASVHIANTINEYFTPVILENINVFLSAASPVIANALSMRELGELQRNTRAAFARYVPADAMDELIEKSSKMVSHSESRNVTVLFADIRDFTALCEKSNAQGVVDFLNEYFAKMGNEIISESGHIDKFIGDALMAVFGAFGNIENPCENSIHAAIKMLCALDELNTKGEGLFTNKIKIGIGINFGECILGNIGFQNKMDYTIIGDTVNLASRIESLTKLYRHPLIISEFAHDTVKDSFIYRKLDNVRVMGKKKPAGIYAVYTNYDDSLNEKSDMSALPALPILPILPALTVNRDALLNYNKGLQLFYIREWKLAQEFFEKAIQADKNDYHSQIYLQRTIDFSQNEPPYNWDGVVTLVEK